MKKGRLEELSLMFSLNGFALGLATGLAIAFILFLMIDELPEQFGTDSIISVFFNLFTVLGTICAAGLALIGVRRTIENANALQREAYERKRIAADATVNVAIATLGAYAKQYILYRINPPCHPVVIPKISGAQT